MVRAHARAARCSSGTWTVSRAKLATMSKLPAAHAQPAGVLVEGDLVGVAGGQLAAHGEQLRGQLAQPLRLARRA